MEVRGLSSPLVQHLRNLAPTSRGNSSHTTTFCGVCDSLPPLLEPYTREQLSRVQYEPLNTADGLNELKLKKSKGHSREQTFQVLLHWGRQRWRPPTTIPHKHTPKRVKSADTNLGTAAVRPAELGGLERTTRLRHPDATTTPIVSGTRGKLMVTPNSC